MKELVEGVSLGYLDLVNSFEHTVLLESSIGDYQGDYLFLLQDKNRIGFLVQGYGSCSYCDALENAFDSGFQEVVSLRDSMHSSIRWFESNEEAVTWFKEQEGSQWYYYETEWSNFRDGVINLLSGHQEQ